MHLPSQVALYLTLGFMGFLFRREIRGQQRVSSALWIPTIWLTVIGSRFITEWLAIFGLHLGAVNVEDGSPLDAAIFGILIVAGVYILNQRRVVLAEVVQNNKWVAVFLGYCFLAIIWSDFPFVALKRWLKVLGHPIMVLLILTESDPEEAIVQLLKRCSYVWIPISILWIKYFPDLGRGFSVWTGAAENHGIAVNKNMLGLDVFISATFFFWYFLKVLRWEKGKERRNELILIALFGYMNGWLLHMSQSSTSMVSFFIAAGVMLFLGLRFVNAGNITAYLVAIVLVCVVGEGVFGLYSSFLHVLGKSPTLTDRTLLWHNVLKMEVNPVIGAGYESFWLGDHIKPSNWPGWSFVPNEAHNCYLETYLNLGVAGVILLLGWYVATYRKACQAIMYGDNRGRFRLAYLVAVIFYNWTEAPFKAVDPVYFIYFLIAMDYPMPAFAPAAEPVKPDLETEGELTPAHGCTRVANNETACPDLGQTACVLQNGG